MYALLGLSWSAICFTILHLFLLYDARRHEIMSPETSNSAINIMLTWSLGSLSAVQRRPSAAWAEARLALEFLTLLSCWCNNDVIFFRATPASTVNFACNSSLKCRWWPSRHCCICTPGSSRNWLCCAIPYSFAFWWCQKGLIYFNTVFHFAYFDLLSNAVYALPGLSWSAICFTISYSFTPWWCQA